jgi:MraZ protein
LYFAQTEKAAVDRAGRVVLPERHAAHAGLRHEVILLGAGDHLELWDAQRWQRLAGGPARPK